MIFEFFHFLLKSLYKMTWGWNYEWTNMYHYIMFRHIRKPIIQKKHANMSALQITCSSQSYASQTHSIPNNLIFYNISRDISNRFIWNIDDIHIPNLSNFWLFTAYTDLVTLFTDSFFFPHYFTPICFSAIAIVFPRHSTPFVTCCPVWQHFPMVSRALFGHWR
jgi:hypothetical protein